MATYWSNSLFKRRSRNVQTHIPYCYESLDLNASNQLPQIRLIDVPPLGPKDPLAVSIRRVNLREGGYDAISYWWGDPEPVKHIVCNGQPISISENVYAILMRLQEEAQASRVIRTVWIDALCINQLDDTERSNQVRWMHKIYSKADRVLIWLGAKKRFEQDLPTMAMAIRTRGLLSYNGMSPDTIAERMKVYADIQSRIVKTPHLLGQTLEDIHNDESKVFSDLWCWVTGSIFMEKEQIAGDIDKAYRTLWSLLERPWFRRLWVVQEVAVAKSVYLMCGRSTLTWEDFTEVISEPLDMSATTIWRPWKLELAASLAETRTMLLEKSGRIRAIEDTISLTTQFSSMASLSSGTGSFLSPKNLIINHDSSQDDKPSSAIIRNPSLDNETPSLNALHLLLRHMHRECSDPRDKLFALCGLSKDFQELGIAPNYLLGCEELYHKFALKYIVHNANLDMLSAPCIHAPTISGAHSSPSWVPNWQLPTPCIPLIALCNPARAEQAGETTDAITSLHRPHFAACPIRKTTVITSQDRKRLRLKCVLVDTVNECGMSFEHPQQTEDFTPSSKQIAMRVDYLMNVLADWERLSGVQGDAIHNTGQSALYVFALTIVAGHIRDNEVVEAYQAWQEYLSSFRFIHKYLPSSFLRYYVFRFILVCVCLTERTGRVSTPERKHILTAIQSLLLLFTFCILLWIYQRSYEDKLSPYGWLFIFIILLAMSFITPGRHLLYRDKLVYAMRRRLVRTNRGYLALFPSTCQPGDQIGIFEGGKVPLLIRKEGSAWVLVGDGYVYGMMEGELWDESKCENIWLE